MIMSQSIVRASRKNLSQERMLPFPRRHRIFSRTYEKEKVY